ncbi:hypothetical protein ACNFZ6_05050 [Enterobacter hormaechei]|uniref:hypothetical protein n=1 Tax=Enterobacter hormaechei TaxID=158836 RepID=UPI003CE9833A
MTNYSLRARMMILILAPTVLIGLLLSIFFVVHRYNDLQRQLEDAGGQHYRTAGRLQRVRYEPAKP